MGGLCESRFPWIGFIQLEIGTWDTYQDEDTTIISIIIIDLIEDALDEGSAAMSSNSE